MPSVGRTVGRHLPGSGHAPDREQPGGGNAQRPPADPPGGPHRHGPQPGPRPGPGGRRPALRPRHVRHEVRSGDDGPPPGGPVGPGRPLRRGRRLLRRRGGTARPQRTRTGAAEHLLAGGCGLRGGHRAHRPRAAARLPGHRQRHRPVRGQGRPQRPSLAGRERGDQGRGVAGRTPRADRPSPTRWAA